uniref:Uncharacterized protein n=1 Tax=Plectus sambesii TaxID=2011161 RepID=A0A914X1Y7_9BILA
MNAPEAGQARPPTGGPAPARPPLGGPTMNPKYATAPKGNGNMFGALLAVGAAAGLGYYFYQRQYRQKHPIQAQADKLSKEIHDRTR